MKISHSFEKKNSQKQAERHDQNRKACICQKHLSYANLGKAEIVPFLTSSITQPFNIQ